MLLGPIHHLGVEALELSDYEGRVRPKSQYLALRYAWF